ncbi:MAG: IclR family transcriptional regulator [Burkholderiaceae bacterium]
MARSSRDSNGMPADDRYFITALARGLDVLSCFKSTDKALSNQQIVERCGLPKSTVTRITATLVRLGYLRSSDDIDGRFALGMKTLALGTAAIAGMDVRRIARPMLQDLADQTHSGVSIAVRSNFSLVYIEVCNGVGALGLTIQIGSRVRLASSAIARAYLAEADERERAEILAIAKERGEQAYQGVLDDIRRGEQDIAAYGCTTSMGDWQEHINGIALAFRPPGDPVLMSINCGGAASILPPKYLLEEAAPRLIRIVEQLRGR